MSVEAPLTKLFVDNRAMILRYLRALGGDDRADDLLQDLWLKVQRAPNVGQVSRAYLMKMPHNLALDDMRSNLRRGQRDRSWQVDGADGFEIDQSPNAEQILMSRESLRIMEELLRSLGPRTERIIRRHRIDDVSQKQLAAEEGLSLSAVEKHLQKAYRAIASAQVELDAPWELSR
ncbi:sigma-70 family RNA polymerase sigma factor [Sphingomonas sp. BK235]|uniref:RNA polymerase sigma factor n=1 Tax=Sphingomonas sp. BK235 TaxID=2512131 RepID=UPI0010EE8A84|nr:sigma-70 family RNA polymerase sigma factor [Sphingomonas sp. BK235]TCP30107.1 RNA polymerase sigma-70 factor (ECF subfamily) [Sphingomonas sp. BK235]